MSRSYKKHPFSKGRDNSWKEHKVRSSRNYRHFVKDRMSHEDYDNIHNNNKVFWDRWNWSPEYRGYFGDDKNPELGYRVWEYSYEVGKGRDLEEVLEEILQEKREYYKKGLRK